jgi:ribosomal protein S27AE
VTDTTQRVYRAACPNCGAPVDFRSAASAFAVCSYCRSQVLRDGDALHRIGESAELFDDHSPLQLGAAGRAHGAAFTLVGRLQYRAAGGTWNEWHALFDTGRSGWLSEDNGRYVLAFDAALAAPPPPAEALRPGEGLTVDGRAWRVASVVSATLIAAQGELPAPPVQGRAFAVADLRNAQDEVGTLDYGDAQRPAWSVGRAVALADLALTGLADATAEKTLAGRSLSCPNCGNAVEIRLESTRSVVCGQCQAVIDVSQGLGGDLQHFVQAGGGVPPPIPLGSVGTLALGGAALAWQVVGCSEHREIAQAGDAADEASSWTETLLYHRQAGFAFLVLADEGWSWAAPITGTPEGSGERLTYRGARYRQRWHYRSRVARVLGEFYWPVRRGQETLNTDYHGEGAAAARRLSREETRGAGGDAEVVWSAGEVIPADAVRAAFHLAGPAAAAAATARDTGPVSALAPGLLIKIVLLLVLAFVASLMRCSRDDCDEVRTSFGADSAEYSQCQAHRATGGSHGGGSYGGFSSGGGHK